MSDDELLDGRYRLTRRIGRGGVAEVFEAIDERLARRVAIKLFSGSAADELSRHESEMAMLAQLDNPGLVTVYDAGHDTADRPFLVMQLIDGGTLAEENARAGALPPEQVAAWGASLAGALAYVHGQGIVHRDLKPANVLVGRDGRVHLADFGIARLVDSASLTRVGDVVGSPAYFAPEQVAGEPVGPAADVYSLGLVLLESLTGRREYDGPPTEAAIARLSREPVVPDRLTVAWRSLLTAMLARTPASRPLASDVSGRLEGIAATTGTLPMDATRLMAPLPPVAAAAAPTTRLPVAEPTTVLGRPDATTVSREPSSGRGQRVGIAVAIVLLVVLIAGGITAVIARGNGGTASSHWTPGQPTIPKHRVEVAVTRLETAVKQVNSS